MAVEMASTLFPYRLNEAKQKQSNYHLELELKMRWNKETLQQLS
jgi:hypothetical protein